MQERVNIGSIGPDGHLYTKYFPGNVFSVALVYKLTARPNDAPYLWVKEVAPSIAGARGPLGWGLSWGMRLMTPTLPVFGFLAAPVVDRA